MPSSMPRRTDTLPISLTSCIISAFPSFKQGRRPHHMVAGLARCSFALRSARSLTPSLQEPFTPRASGTSLLPCSPRLLPAGAKVAGWVYLTLPLEFCALVTAHLNGLLEPSHVGCYFSNGQ